MTSEPDYVSSTVDLTAGDRIVMFTDGLIERRERIANASFAGLRQHAQYLRTAPMPPSAIVMKMASSGVK